jgi:hypothetical protein
MEDLGWKRRRGSSPVARRGARQRVGLTPVSGFQHPFMPAGDTSHPNQINPIKNPLDSDHGIYRERRDDDTIHALLRPASKKRQSTKSREVGQRRCRGRYGDLAAVRDLSAG